MKKIIGWLILLFVLTTIVILGCKAWGLLGFLIIIGSGIAACILTIFASYLIFVDEKDEEWNE